MAKYKELIYLASPYSHPDASRIEGRVATTQWAAAKLIERGHLIYSPIVHTHPIADQVNFVAVHDANTDLSPGAGSWLDYDFGMIDKADELWVLMIDGWLESRGVKAEVRHAYATYKPIRYVCPNALVIEDSPFCGE